jgi:hypothetical protein
MEVPTPLLLIVSQDSVLLHEEYDEARADRLAAQIRKDGMLKDPPIVGRLPQVSQMIELDGTNRLVALRRMGLDVALVQVVDYLDPALRLSSWYHIVHGREPGELLAAVRNTPGLSLEHVNREDADAALAQRTIIAYLSPSSEPDRAYAISIGTDLPGQAHALNAIVHLYKYAGSTPIRRISSEEAVSWPQHGPVGEGQAEGIMVAFPTYTPHEVAEMALSGKLLPSGVTRHLLPVRALGVSLPLDVLTRPATLEERNAALEQLIAARARAGRVRFYHEPTFVYDD